MTDLQIKEKARERWIRYHYKHKNELKEYKKRYYIEHKKELKDIMKRYRTINREEINQHNRCYYVEHREEIRAKRECKKYWNEIRNKEQKMKTIELSDEDYNTLMELSKEYQTQDNDMEAFPYLWEPSSSKLVPNVNGEGEVTKIYKDCEEYTPQQFAELNEDDFDAFIEENVSSDDEYPDIKCDGKDFDKVERDWIEYIEMNSLGNVTTYDWVDESEHNPSLFKSDVENFIKFNYYHLGKEPHTYARTSWRMYKMEKLISILCRINKQDDADNEIKSRVFQEEQK